MDGVCDVDTNEDRVLVKSWKKWLVRSSVLLFVVVVGTAFPRFKDIIAFDILECWVVWLLNATGKLCGDAGLLRAAVVPALEAHSSSVNNTESDRLGFDGVGCYFDGCHYPSQYYSAIRCVSCCLLNKIIKKAQ